MDIAYGMEKRHKNMKILNSTEIFMNKTQISCKFLSLCFFFKVSLLFLSISKCYQNEYFSSYRHTRRTRHARHARHARHTVDAVDIWDISSFTSTLSICKYVNVLKHTFNTHSE